MAAFNHCTFIGNLCSDPKLATSKEGKAVANYSIAVNNPFKKEVLYVGISTFGKNAENDAKNLRKGDSILVSGNWLSNESYTGKDGNKHYALKLVPTNVQYLKKSSADRNGVPDGYTQVEDDGLPY